MTLGVSPAAGRYTTFRNVILRTAVGAFSNHLGTNVRPASADWHWNVSDVPCIGVFQADPFADINELASQCDVVVRLDLVFIAGAPGADHVGLLADHWSDWIIGKRPLGGVKDDELWHKQDVVPVVETVGGFREVDFGHGQPLVASISTIRSEMHQEK